MSENLKEIPIFFAIDDGYTKFLAVTIQSLIENASKDYKYLIKVLHTNVQKEHMEQIKKYENQNVSISGIHVTIIQIQHILDYFYLNYIHNMIKFYI